MRSETNILPGNRLRVDDSLLLVDLTVERALGLIDPSARANYAAAYEWFMSYDGTPIRKQGIRIPGASSDFTLTAQRGIHVPSRQAYALSITVRKQSIYDKDDKSLVKLPDGTWILEYSEHRNNSGKVTDTHWNAGLLACLRDGIPIGVFIEEEPSRYSRYLAFVEDYQPDRGTFTLHGPVTAATRKSFSSPVLDIIADGTQLELEYDSSSVEELQRDSRAFAKVQQAVRRGQAKFRNLLLEAYGGRCAGTGCDISETLQAAHIINYRGVKSNTVRNGILLRADLHLLFDNSLITVDPETTRIVTSTRLANSEYGELSGHKLLLPSDEALTPNPEYLNVHYENFLQLESAS